MNLNIQDFVLTIIFYNIMLEQSYFLFINRHYFSVIS